MELLIAPIPKKHIPLPRFFLVVVVQLPMEVILLPGGGGGGAAKATHSPIVKPAVDERVVHGATHSDQPDDHIDVAAAFKGEPVHVEKRQELVGVEGQPTDGKDSHDDHYHLYDLFRRKK